ncbi:MAG: CBS domain-containing protein [Deltaproteobacteria bacterium]|nr:CBS domain-containing protein [Deltaproteobacteria bacterium]MBW2417617.1 CBS domain-containing protein [Deltaproteobacteria bacterium]
MAEANERSVVEVGEIMQPKLVTVSVGDRLSVVEDIMTLGRVRHIPVVRGGEFVGVLSDRDVLRASLSNLNGRGADERRGFLHAVEIAKVMSEPPVVITPDASIVEAARVMVEHKIGCLPVVNHEGRGQPDTHGAEPGSLRSPRGYRLGSVREADAELWKFSYAEQFGQCDLHVPPG